jgi:low affinity Fe/Cu permease
VKRLGKTDLNRGCRAGSLGSHLEEASLSSEVITPQRDQSTPITRAVGHATAAMGSFPAILVSVTIIASWATGLFFVKGGFLNQDYQLVINTLTTIITFLMVFIIQNTQNRDGRAVQAKLDAQSEVLRAIAERLGIADDEDLLTKLVGVEDAPDHVIKEDQKDVRRVAVQTGRHGAARSS